MSDRSPQSAEQACSFCRKTPAEVRNLVFGPGVSICDECVTVCVDIIEDDRRAEAAGQATQPRRLSSASWLGGPGTGYCSLCRMPVVLDEALLVEGKGLLCEPCVSEVAARADKVPVEERQ